MQLVTAQHRNVLQELKTHGIYIPSKDRIDDEYYRESYEWLKTKMHTHNPYQSETMVWNWLGKKLRVPVTKGDIIIRYTVEPDQVLLSDYHYWHHVLNKWNVTYNETEDERLNGQLDISTWDRILDINFYRHPEIDPLWVGSEQLFQATTWHIELNTVDRIYSRNHHLLYTKKKGFLK